MKYRVEYAESTVRRTEIEFDGTLEELVAEWEQGYASGTVDEIEEYSTEIDGGIVWESAVFSTWDPKKGWEPA